MDGIDVILQAEKEAERIRRDAQIEAEAAVGSAEGYRQRAMEAARREGEEEIRQLADQAEKRANVRRAELKAVADAKNAAMRSEAEARLDSAAEKIAERIAGF
ncbi:MAG: hypothetical protein IKP17_05310 [Oscillospiraceae bacterium]|jgi:flagellar biosynthesis/type III secretory pathway protein FliH|nr:hypothetical protein [Oscillospiraceae bacterium]MBR4692156.1 hypothetical protein [Oscillospiraceae bacterium]